MSAVDCVNFCEAVVLKKAVVDELRTQNVYVEIVFVWKKIIWRVIMMYTVCFRVLDQHKMSKEQWEERIVTWYQEHRGMLRWVSSLPLSFPTVPSSLSVPATVSYQQPALSILHPPPVSLISSLHRPPISAAAYSCIVGVFWRLCFYWFSEPISWTVIIKRTFIKCHRSR